MGALPARTLVLLAALLATMSPAAAQDTTVIQLDRLPVTVARGTTPVIRLPAAYTSVAGDAIRSARPTVGLDESLDRVPGVFVNNRYNFSLGTRISIRGLGARAAFGVRGIRVLSDGIPLTMPDGQTNLNNVELGTADRVQVLRGPSSALYGNAAGGVIVIETEAAPAALAGEVRAFGSNGGSGGAGLGDFFKLQARAGGPLLKGGWVASVSRMETDGYRDYSRARQTLVNAVARQPIGPSSSITFIVNVFDSPVAESAGALPIDSARANPRMAWPNNVRTRAGEATTQAQFGVAFAHAVGSDRFDISAYGLGRNVDNALPFAWIDLERRGGGMRASWAGASAAGRLRPTAGVDIEWASDDRQEFNNAAGQRGTTMNRDQEDQVTTIAPFAQVLFAASDRLDLVAGLRYDRTRFQTSDRFTADGRDDSGERTLDALSPMAGVSFAASDRLRVYANVATAFQTPTTTELINAPPAPSQICCPGGFNADLDPQRARSFEAGARGRIGRLDIDVAAFHMNVENTIVPFQVEDVDGREFFRNAGESRHRGVELAASVPIGRHSLSAAWTYTSLIFVDDGDPETAYEGNDLPGVPRSRFYANARLEPIRRLGVEVGLNHVGSYYANDANDETARNDAATVLDLRFTLDGRVAGRRISPFLAISNLNDERYFSSVVVNAVGRRYYEPAPQRSVLIGLSLATGAWSSR